MAEGGIPLGQWSGSDATKQLEETIKSAQLAKSERGATPIADLMAGQCRGPKVVSAPSGVPTKPKPLCCSNGLKRPFCENGL
jgi:hypothetical protein